jgi:hypothetical protein
VVGGSEHLEDGDGGAGSPLTSMRGSFDEMLSECGLANNEISLEVPWDAQARAKSDGELIFDRSPTNSSWSNKTVRTES